MTQRPFSLNLNEEDDAEALNYASNAAKCNTVGRSITAHQKFNILKTVAIMQCRLEFRVYAFGDTDTFGEVVFVGMRNSFDCPLSVKIDFNGVIYYSIKAAIKAAQVIAMSKKGKRGEIYDPFGYIFTSARARDWSYFSADGKRHSIVQIFTADVRKGRKSMADIGPEGYVCSLLPPLNLNFPPLEV